MDEERGISRKLNCVDSNLIVYVRFLFYFRSEVAKTPLQPAIVFVSQAAQNSCQRAVRARDLDRENNGALGS